MEQIGEKINYFIKNTRRKNMDDIINNFLLNGGITLE